MNEPIAMMRRPSIEAAIRTAIADPRKKRELLDATGWDDSMLSKLVQEKPAGITLDKLDIVLAALDHVVVTRSHLDAMCTMGKVGMFCECARRGR
ncbi:DNA-binding protein [Cupriavidus basilensis]